MESSRHRWIVGILALALPLGFALFTGHAWEDFFITLRSSRNLVEGHGLVFQPGERLHTFTSPLGVLVPAFGYWLTGGSTTGALWILRGVSCAALLGAVLLLERRTCELGLGVIGRTLLLGLILLDGKLTDFSINGMETALLVVSAVWFWNELETLGAPRAGRLGLAAAAMMWTRPDAFILGGALVLPHVVFRDKSDPTRKALWRSLLGGAAVAGICYLPWLLWAWWYYGSPVPHTVTAKATFTPPVHLQSLLMLPFETLRGRSILMDLFMPSYWVFGGWPHWFETWARWLTVGAAFAWLVPGWAKAGRRASLAVFLGMFYLCSIVLFPWYIPPWSVFAAVALSFGADRIAGLAFAAGRTWLQSVLRIGVALCLAVQGTLWLGTAWQMRVHQRVVEDGVRHKVGEWLGVHAGSGDTLFLEPLGYIGYFSNLKIFDFPGLSSRETVAAVRAGATSYAALIERLHPTWVVLRPVEAARSDIQKSRVLAGYEFIRDWNALPALDGVRYMPGRPWSEFEACYLLFRRKE